MMLPTAPSQGKTPAPGGHPKPKQRHVRVLDIPLSRMRACDKNDQLYRRPSLDDADFVALVESMRDHGQLTPATITSDDMIVSGHRRFYAARHLGLATLKCIRINKRSSQISPADLAQYPG